MRSDVQRYCEGCWSCEARRNPVPPRRAPLQSIKAIRPFQFVCIDITELPVTARGSRYILVVQDHFTKYVNLYTMADQKATTIAQHICEQYIREHGIPEELFSNQGRQFESDLIQDLCKLLKIEKKRTMSYHPRGNGLVERFNRTLKDQLAKLLYTNGREWDEYLTSVALSFNATPHSSTCYSPFFLAHGREPRLPADLYFAAPLASSPPDDTPQAYGSQLVNRLEAAFQSTIDRNDHHRMQHQHYFNRHTKFLPYHNGELVWVNDPTTVWKKLEPRWTGPYKVLSSREPRIVYELLDLRHPEAQPKIIHYDRLKPYRSTWPENVPSNSVLPPPQNHEDPLPCPDVRSTNGIPGYTALSGSLPLISCQRPPEGNTSRSPALQSVPSLRRPSGRVSQSHMLTRDIPQPAVPASEVGQDRSLELPRIRSGRIIQKPHRYGH
ncbi:hypothetical protein HHUSO_G3672 [Huso huso]|uniref:Integrase catalytic domain-containing protein n=1 Tax=Huso huso TaxID=61971 RepID=A0ABR1A3A4_HUSHU